MTSAELAILVLVGTGTIAGLVLYILWPEKPPLPPEEALNESIVAQHWRAVSTTPVRRRCRQHHGGIDGPGPASGSQGANRSS